ncbi:MAG: hypothetical protein ABIQ15_03780 [Nocardioides sp.]
MPSSTLRLPVARRAANRVVRLLATGTGVALVLLALFLARRAPLSGAVVGVLAIGLLVATYVPLRVPEPLALSTDPGRPGVLLPGSRAHPGLVATLAAVLIVCVGVTSLPVVSLLGEPTWPTGVLAAVGVLACVLVALNLRALARPRPALVVGPSGLTVPELGDEPVAWERVKAVEVTSAYRRSGVPQHVPVVSLRVSLPDRRMALCSVDPVDLGPDPVRAVDVLQRLAAGRLDRGRLAGPDALALFGQ